MTVHETARAGFVRPDVYEQGRPGYPDGAVGVLDLREGTRVADLGCGTGKLTRQLLGTGAVVVGVEPLASMLATFTEVLPRVPAVAGVAEALPFAASTFDLVVCASAFHWFDHARAIPEIHRVLKPGGRLAIIWNRRDALEGWAAELWQITEVHRGDTPGYRTGAWRQALDASPLFGEITEHSFAHVQRTDTEGLLARVASISFIEILPDDVRRDTIARARRSLQTHPETREKTTFELPYRTAVYVTERR